MSDINPDWDDALEQLTPPPDFSEWDVAPEYWYGEEMCDNCGRNYGLFSPLRLVRVRCKCGEPIEIVLDVPEDEFPPGLIEEILEFAGW